MLFALRSQLKFRQVRQQLNPLNATEGMTWDQAVDQNLPQSDL